MNNWVIHYDIAAIFIMLVISALFLAGHRVYTRASKVFGYILLSGLCTAVFDVLSVYGLSHTDSVSPFINTVFAMMYNLWLMTTIFLYVLYSIVITGLEPRMRHRGIFAFSLPIMVELIMVLITPITRLIFYVDDHGYHRGVGLTQYSVVMCVYVIFIAYRCITSGNHITALQRVALLLFTCAAIFATVLQIFMPDYMLICFALAMGILLVYISLQSDFIDSDRMLGTFNSDAWGKRIEHAVTSGGSLTIIIVRIGGYERLNTQVGYEGCNDVFRQIAELLMKLIPGHQVYHLNGLYFGCILDGYREDAEGYAGLLSDRLNRNFVIDGYKGSVRVPFAITVVKCPLQVKSADEIDYLVNMLNKEPDEYDSGYIHIVSEKDINKLERRKHIEQAMEKAIRGGSFDVWYQPILRMSDMKVIGAEALVRLPDEGIVIFPDEFIPIAEEIGVIHQITECVLNRAANLMSAGKLRDKGVEHMHVNLSAAECVRGDGDGRLAAIIDGYGLKREDISFEISETVAPDDSNPIGEGIYMLDRLGVDIVLDDYGTGFSNMTGIVALPIDVVKIDRSFLRMAMMDERIMIMLGDIISMIHRLNRSVIITGVEDSNALHTVKKLGADYAQGYCFLKPAVQKEFVEYVTNVNIYGMSPIQEKE